MNNTAVAVMFIKNVDLASDVHQLHHIFINKTPMEGYVTSFWGMINPTDFKFLEELQKRKPSTYFLHQNRQKQTKAFPFVHGSFAVAKATLSESLMSLKCSQW